MNNHSYQHSNVVSGKLLNTEILLCCLNCWAIVGCQVVLIKGITNIWLLKLFSGSENSDLMFVLKLWCVLGYPDVMCPSTDKEAQVVHFIHTFRAEESAARINRKH